MGLSSINKTIGSYGNAAVGKVVAVPSSGSEEFYLNDSVFVIGQGLWTDEAIVSASGAVKVPALQPDEAALLPSYISAWAILHNYVTLKAGDTVVQTTGNSAIGKAITAIGKALNLKVLSLSDSELNDPEISKKLEGLGSISLTVTGQSGKVISLLSKVTASNGVVVTYNGVYESFVTTTAVSVAISHLIFRNVSIQGFELLPWVQNSPSEYKAAAHSVLSLLSEKKIVLKPSLVYPQSDYLSGIEAVFKTGDTAVLKH